MPASWPARQQSTGSGNGPAGQDAPLVFVQETPASEWVITHNLGRYSTDVLVMDLNGMQILTEISHESLNRLRVRFAQPQSGRVVVA